MRAFPVATTKERGKCGECAGSICCTYITQQIPTPRSRDDFEHMLWQVSHEGIEIYKDDDGWYLLVHAPCGHLQTGGACGIYARRPPICRSYSNDFCEYDEPADQHFALHFRTYEELLRHYRKRFKRAR